jgi:diguanylate cyclase (GGDEF)-like protein
MTDEYLQSCPEDKLNLLSQKLAEAVRDVIRDIDIPVQFSQDHILILLPNTGIEGTIQEASRIKQEISLVLQREISTKYGDIPTISIGATTSSVQEAFKFTDLLRDATRALREIRAQGGDGVFYC